MVQKSKGPQHENLNDAKLAEIVIFEHYRTLPSHIIAPTYPHTAPAHLQTTTYWLFNPALSTLELKLSTL